MRGIRAWQMAAVGGTLLAALCVVALAAGPPPGPMDEPAAAIERPGGPAGPGMFPGQMRGRGAGQMAGRGLQGFLMNPEVQVATTEDEDGVTLHLTTENAELAEQIKTGLPPSIEQMRERGRGQRGAPARGQGFGLLAAENVNIQVNPTDKGADIVVTSEDPATVAQIKRTLPQQVQRSTEMRERMTAMRERANAQAEFRQALQECLELMFGPQVQTRVEETENGVTLTLTSDDPELVERLKAELAEKIETLRKRREQVGEAGDAPPWGPPMMDGGPQGRRGLQGLPGVTGGRRPQGQEGRGAEDGPTRREHGAGVRRGRGPDRGGDELPAP